MEATSGSVFMISNYSGIITLIFILCKKYLKVIMEDRERI